MAGSNLTLPRISFEWVAEGLRTQWKFEGRGSHKARVVDRILEREGYFGGTTISNSTPVTLADREEVSVTRSSKKPSKKGGK